MLPHATGVHTTGGLWDCADARVIMWPMRRANRAFLSIQPLNHSTYSACKVKVHPCTGTEALYRQYGP